MSIVLRDYQRSACDAAEPLLARGTTCLIVMPTGTGKTSCIGEIVRRRVLFGRILVIAHTEELIDQLAERIQLMNPDVTVGIEMGDRTCVDRGSLYGDASVIVASRQSMVLRIHRYPEDFFGTLIIDEAHHGVAKTYTKIINRFKASLLGVTATPDRGDEVTLRKVFDEVAYSMMVDDAINGGWLTPVRQQFCEVEGLDFTKARTRSGEFSEDKLDQILAAEPRVAHEIAASCVEHCPGQTLVFVPGIEMAHIVAEIVNRFPGESAEVIVGDTHKQRRREIIAAYRRGDVRKLIGVGVFLEGFDAPETRHLFNARPFGTRSGYAQMAGRVMRPLAGILEGLNTPLERIDAIANSAKPFGHIIDLTTSSAEHDLIFSGDILGGKEVSKEARKAALKRAKKVGGPVDLQKIMDEEEAKLRQQREERARRKHVKAQAQTTLHEVGSDAASVGQYNADGQRLPTAKMRAAVARLGYDADGMTFNEAQQIIYKAKQGSQKLPATDKQKAILARNRLPTDVTKLCASVFIDILFARRFQEIDYTPSREYWTIVKDGDKYRAAIKDPDFGTIILQKNRDGFATPDQCRNYFADVFNQMPSLV